MNLITPQSVINTYSVQELCETADAYFRSIKQPEPQMAKPFSSIVEAPEILQNIGHLLSGLHLAKTMSVLEFSAGTCWLSRFLSQLQCSVICCDVSQAALEIGKRLFTEYPIIGKPIAEPRFLHFNGHRIDLPSESVDRIVCNDGFHHVPNQSEVIGELARVLKPGGVAAFSEPGLFHSKSPTSQYEMRNYKVLENDIDLESIASIAEQHGLTNLRIKVVSNMEVPLPDYVSIVRRSATNHLGKGILENVSDTMTNKTIFFLSKGQLQPDSRGHQGLKCVIRTSESHILAEVGDTVTIPIEVTNSGNATWLHTNEHGIGVVKIGAHLYSNDNLLDLDFLRQQLGDTVKPGESIAKNVCFSMNTAGQYRLRIDLVSEGVCWFENLGSEPVEITLTVR